eukprot:14689308-Ditylum_brightwellii.AAC.1
MYHMPPQTVPAGPSHQLTEVGPIHHIALTHQKVARAAASPIPLDAAAQATADAGNSKGALQLLLQ